MAETGMDVRVLQEFIGHENLNVTMKVYNHIDSARLRNEMYRLDAIRFGNAS